MLTTEELSQNALTGPSIGMPNIHNLYLTLTYILTAICNAANFEPKDKVSTVFCDFEYHNIGKQFKKMSIPVCECLVTLLPA